MDDSSESDAFQTIGDICLYVYVRVFVYIPISL